MPSPRRAVHIRRSSLPAEAEAEAAIAVEEGGGVDLAAVGRALGLDPATVLLNGYFVSRGLPGHVSAAVTWRALLAFFAKRGLPAGDHPAAAIAVQGKPAPTSTPASDRKADAYPKRKFGLGAERSFKKSKHSEDGVDMLSDEITLGLKRRLKLDDANPTKKMKQTECSTVNGAETQQPVKFSCSFINGHGKRSRDEEMITTSFSRKRAR
uniref:Uncharacterized protein n=1 Tax=Leersia perrieri TaxID=77586 RepID=A0A0D9V9K0_9ORYZ